MEENNEQTTEQTTDATPETQQATPEAPQAKAPSKQEDFKFDDRLYTKDGQFNKDGAREYIKEVEETQQKYEERLLGLRKIVSRNGEAVKNPEEYIQDYTPPVKYTKFFSEDTPEETREYMSNMTTKLSKKYLDMGLNKQQAWEVNNAILDVMEEVGVLDTRTDEQKYIDDKKYIEEQRGRLGANAENIIREAETFILSTSEFDAKQKNKMLDMIKGGDMGLVSIMHSIKDAFGAKTGGIPNNITALGGLGTDTQLWAEYQKATPERRAEIIAQRHKAGRSGKLSDAGNI